MASPPYRSPAQSPPYPSSASLPNPKKRPSLSVTSHPPAAKRRKPTNASQASTPATSHPLRQTSFPPQGSAVDIGERSPSVESDVTGMTGLTGHQSTMTSGNQQRKPKKRGRKKKTEEGSVVNGGKLAAADAASAAGNQAEEAEDDEDDAEENDVVMGDQEKQQRAKEKADLGFLIDHFNADQLRRYEYMRRNKFKKENVRRIVNQTLSQSVPPSVVIGIGGYTKLLVGLLIERARDVQQQRAAVAAAAYPSPASDTPSTRTVAGNEGNGASTQQTALQSSSFNSAASLSSDDRFAASSFERQPAHPDTDSDTDRPPELNHNDIFGPASSPPQPISLSVPPELPLNSLKPPPSPSRQQLDPPSNAQISRSPSAPRQSGTAHMRNEGDQTKPKAEFGHFVFLSQFYPYHASPTRRMQGVKWRTM
ncbi:MAG: hypothetical protein LQ346_004066 [Caloplaca aetnensis]|nr:MAG: hypothetical protein LQ346_004066 [Caloplaca aetnensis]